MNTFVKLIVGLGMLFFAALLFAGCQIKSGYDKAITLQEVTEKSWAQVENQLQARYDLIPNLVETVKGFAAQEEEIFLGIAKSREAYFNAKSIPDKAKAATGLEGVLSRLLVLNEKYPDLKSNESFLKLQDTLEGTERRIAVERKRYNDAVASQNTFVKKLFGRFYASLAGVGEAEYFKVEEAAKSAPKVDFSKP